MQYLAFDTSTQVLSVAIGDEKQVLAEYTTNNKKDHSSRLMPTVERLMKEVGIVPENLDGMIVGKGPGSYTGLRIGVSTAKSMAWALGIPIVGVSSLSLLARGGKYFNGFVVPLIDARRGQVYTGLYGKVDDQWATIEKDRIILMKDWLDYLKNTYVLQDSQANKLLFISSEIELYREMIESVFNAGDVNTCSMGAQYSRAGELLEIGIPMLENRQNEDSKGLAPEYLRLAEAEYNWIVQQNKIQKTD